MTQGNRRTGGRVLVDALRIHGVDTVFCVPGESYLAALDALYDARDAIATIACRHEGGAANMAEACGKLTGRPGVVMVTRGPGACHAAAGLHTAAQDSTPMVMFIGQVERGHSDREAFQEIEYRRFLDPLCKWVVQIDDPARIPELVSQAFHRACSGRPGPVAVALPEDVLAEETGVADTAPYTAVSPGVADDAIPALRKLLAAARRPLVIAGGGGWSVRASEDLARFAEANALAVAASFRCQDRLDNTHPCYAGDLGLGIDPGLAERVREADLLLVIGARLGEMTTRGYTLVAPPCPRQTLVHVHPDPDELGRVYQPILAICAGSAEFLRATAAMPPVDSSVWRESTVHAHERYLASVEPTAGLPGPVEMGKVMAYLRERLPPGGDPHHRRRQLLRVGAPALRLPQVPEPDRPDRRGDGLRDPGRRRGTARLSRPPGGGVLRRRRRPDDRAGDRDRGAPRDRSRHPRGEQLDVRNHPDAPGAGVSGSRDRHRPHQPGLRGLGGEASAPSPRGWSAPTSSPPRSRPRSAPGVWPWSSCGSTRS